MKNILHRYFLPDAPTLRWWLALAASLLPSIALLLLRPLGLAPTQARVVASVVLVILWWSTGLVKKIPASLFLLGSFSLFSGVALQTVFSFPLSETFPMIAVTYLFSQGISNSGLIERLIQPLLLRLVHTPCQCLVAITAVLYLTMYVIPQPLARLIIVATVFHRFLQGTDLPEETRSVVMYGVFLLSAVVNMSCKDADMIMNHVAASFSQVPISNTFWTRAMLPPTLLTCLLVGLVFVAVFRRQLLGLRLQAQAPSSPQPCTAQQKAALGIIAATVALWMTSGLHGLNSTLITLAATAALFAIHILGQEDWKALDVTTLIFLTAAFSIGGVMRSCGAADLVFGRLRGIFPAHFSVGYLLVMLFVGMLLHMILGSNTTTLSVVIPGMMVLCSQVVSDPIIVFTAVLSVSFHAILPFHSVSMMVGASNDYFPARYVTRMGPPLTALVYLAAACLFLPYWRLIGLI